MAKQPELVRSADDRLRVDASFPNGRYTFSLRPAAVDLVRDLGYRPGDVLPWDLFKALAIVGDVWLPNANDGIADDLAAPDAPIWMDDDEAAAVADYLRSRRVGPEDRERLADLFDSSTLGRYLSMDDLDSKSEWVERTASLVSSAEGSDSLDGEAEAPAADAVRGASLLHVGKTTLGRRNMGWAVRADDYLDAFAEAVDVAISRKVDAVLQTGRLFQSRSPDRETVSDLQTQLRRLQKESIPFYIVCGPKERELRSTVVDSLATSGLLTPIGGRAVEVGDGVTLIGVDADSGPEAAVTALADDVDGPLLVACGDADLSEPDDPLVGGLLDRLPTRPTAIVAGASTDPVRTGRAGVPLLDPGSVEHILSKSTIDEEPPARGVDELAISDSELSVTRHELDVRPFATFEFEVTESTTLESIEEDVSNEDLAGQAVLARLVGSDAEARRPSREAVQSMLAERAFCARVYDDRSVPDDAGETETEATSGIQTDRLAAAVADLANVVAALESLESADPSEMETPELADSYAVLSKAKSEVEDLRKAARDELTSRVGPDETVAGEIGAVTGAKQRQRRLRDDETVEAVLREHGVPRERVTTETIESEKVDEVLKAEDDIDEDDLFEVTEYEYVSRRDLDLSGGVELDATGENERSESEGEGEESRTDREPHKVYLGDGAPIGGWTPVDRSVVEDEIVPLVNAHAGGDDETIAVNFSSGVSASGWNRVDADVVREQIVPLIEQHRVP